MSVADGGFESEGGRTAHWVAIGLLALVSGIWWHKYVRLKLFKGVW